MSDWSVSVIKELDIYFFTLSAQEAAVIGSLIVSLVSLCAACVLLRRRLHARTPRAMASDVGPPETGAWSVNDVVAAQTELRELVREFSGLASQVLQTVDRNQMLPRLPEAGGAALQLLDLGLAPAEAARATGMTMGEVALLMNLRKAKSSALRLPAMSSIGANESPDEAVGNHAGSDGRPLQGNGNGHQEG